METKPRDIPYCGVREEVIKNAKPVLNEEVLGYYHLYLTERHIIYKKKEIEKIPPPWTEDDVLRDNRFTNVRRELDKESVWLIQNISENDELTLEDKILNSILFRTFNKSSTSKVIKQPILNLDSLTEERIQGFKQIFKEYETANPGYVFFTGAFMSGGLKKGNAFNKPPYVRKTATLLKDGEEIEMKYVQARDIANSRDDWDIKDWEKNIPTRMLRLVQKFVNSGGLQRILNAENQQDVYNTLIEINGFSKFLAYQVYVDLTYIPEFPFSENEFVISGPGCSNGLNLLFENKDGMTDEECLFWLTNNIEYEFKQRALWFDLEVLFDHLPEYDRCVNLMQNENANCELSKIYRIKNGEGRARKRYIAKDTNTSLSEELF